MGTTVSPVASIIVSTYNRPAALELVLHGYFQQINKHFEIVIADDGSGPETTDLIRKMKSLSPVPITHVWQPDEGFKKCAALNKAILASQSEYLIFTDGDCIPRADYVAQHLHARAPGLYLSGALFRLNAEVTDSVTVRDVETQAVFSPKAIRARGQFITPRNAWKLTKSRWWSDIYERLSTAPASWNGANSSCWKKDAQLVNGFDERMTYGAEDREFGVRLVHSGIKGKKIRYKAVCAHLDHKRSYQTGDGWSRNIAIHEHTKQNWVLRTPNGIEQSKDFGRVNCPPRS